MNAGFTGRTLKGLPKERIIVLLALTIVLFLIYIFYLVDMQLVKNTVYENRATALSRRVIPIHAQRGEIYDRNGSILVQNVPSFAVDIIPAEIDKDRMQTLFKSISETLNIKVEDIAKIVPPEYYRLFQPLEIKSAVPLVNIAKIAENNDQFPGIVWHSKPIRNYLDIGALSHVIGYVGNITKEEFQVLYNKGYDINSYIGKTGIEKQYDQILRGVDGERIRTVDVQERSVGNEDENLIILPEMGKNIVLTIDRKIQRLVERSLGPRIGSAIALKANTGEILAMVSYPYFDPNTFYTDRASQIYTELSLDPSRPFLNRTIQSAYAPASSFKVIMTAAVLNEKAFPLEETVNCEGKLWFGDRFFNCHVLSGHGELNLAHGLAQSCDVFFYTMGAYHLGVEKIVQYGDMFGLGHLTGIDIAGEIPGILPSPEWKELNMNDRWVGGDTVNMSIGQGFLLVTPIQMANAIAMIANDGTAMKPKLIKEIRDPQTGDIIKNFEPEVGRVSSMSEESLKTLQEYMRLTITDGTAESVISEKVVQIAGKTGTGEVFGKDAKSWSSWFVAYGPYDGPVEDRIVVVVNVEAVNDWEWWAPKASNAIFQGIFADQTYEEVVSTLKHSYLRDNL